MRKINGRFTLSILVIGCLFGVSANAQTANEVLFSLLNKGGCKPSSLTNRSWTISTGPVGTHGELVLGDVLVFEPLASPTGISKKTPLLVTRNGKAWKSVNGWYGECLSDGTLSQYIVSGDVEIDGCLHDIAIGRLDHDDGLSNKIEVVFMDSSADKDWGCASYTILHPGHAHGTED